MTTEIKRASNYEDGETLSLTTVRSLLSAESPEELYRAAVEEVEQALPADLVKLAVASDGFLVPTATSEGAHLGREHAVLIPTSIPGAVYSNEEACLIDDLHDARGAAPAPNPACEPSGRGSDLQHRSLVCAPIEGYGVLVGLASEPELFEDEDLQMLRSIASIVKDILDLMVERDSMQPDATNRLLEQIASVISHEINNNLNIARGRLQLAEETSDREHFVSVRDALESIESIADMVATLARSGEPVGEFEQLELGKIARRQFRPLNTPESQLRVKASASVLADEDCLGQLLENLFRNAIEHSNGPVSIEVGLLADGFYVADDGPGIPEAMEDRVFELGVTTDESHDGAGLAIVSQLADAHDWSVDLTDSLSGGVRIEVTGVVFC